MSGPKCSEYSFDDAAYRRQEELRRREELRRVQEAQRGIERASAALMRLRSSLSAARATYSDEVIDVAIPDVIAPVQMNYGALEAHLSQLRAVLAKAESDVAAAVGHAEGSSSMKSLLTGVAQSINARAASVEDIIAKLPKSSSITEKAVENRRNNLGRIIGGLSENDLTTGMHQLMAEIIAAPTERADALELELRRQVQLTNRRIEQSKREREEAQNLFASLPSGQSAELEQLKAELLRASCGLRTMDSGLRDRAERTSESLRQQEKDIRAGAAAEEALKSLGYEVGESFATLFVEGGEAHFQRPEWGNYFVSFKVNRDDKLLNFRVVRSNDDGASREQLQRDIEMETRWCTEYANVIHRLNAVGVQTRQVSAFAPGIKPVQVSPKLRAAVGRNKDRRGASAQLRANRAID